MKREEYLGKLGHIEEILRNMPGEPLGIFRSARTYLGDV